MELVQNFNYACPYCLKNTKYNGAKFDSWKSIRSHLRRCTLNSKSYMICEYYGPISFRTLESYPSIQAFKKDYPKLSFHSNQWSTLRRRHNLDIFRAYSKEDCITLIQQFYKENNRIPTGYEFENSSPERTTIIKIFGTWNSAIKASGFIPSESNGFSIRTKGKDGILYDSKVEAYFSDNYLYGKYTYNYEPKYGDGRLFDFYIKELDVYIEIDGGFADEVKGYRAKMNNKIQYCLENNIKLLVIPFRDIYKNGFTIQEN
jgi:hypothetical protein